MLRKTVLISTLFLFANHIYAEEKPTTQYKGRTLTEWTTALKEPKTRWEAQSALPHLGAEGVQAVLAYHEPNVCPSLNLTGLSDAEFSATVPALQAALTDKDVLIRRVAPELIAMLPPALRKPLIPDLIKALRDSDFPVRCHAAQILGKFGADSKDAVTPLIESLFLDDKDLQMFAMGALAEIGPDAQNAVPFLITKFEKATNDHERCHIPYVVAKIGSGSPDVVPFVRNAAKDKGFNTRNFAVQGLGILQAVESIPDLIAVVKKTDEMDNIRISAADALGKFGTKAVSAVSALATMSREPKANWQVRGAAMTALVKVDAVVGNASGTLIANLKDPDGMVLIQTANAITLLGPLAKPILPAMVEALQTHRDKKEAFTTVRLILVQNIGALEVCAEVDQALQVATKDPDTMVARVAREMLQPPRPHKQKQPQSAQTFRE